MYYHGASAWAKTHQIETEILSGELKSFFLEVSTGKDGRDAIRGEYESAKAIYAIDPDCTNNPIGWGSFRDSPDTHFSMCKFRALSEDVPNVAPFCRQLAALHRDPTPNGNLGPRAVTYNSCPPQDKGYEDS